MPVRTLSWATCCNVFLSTPMHQRVAMKSAFPSAKRKYFTTAFRVQLTNQSYNSNNSGRRVSCHLATQRVRFSSSTVADNDNDEKRNLSLNSLKRKRNETATSGLWSQLQPYNALAKGRLSALVVTTTAAGYMAAGPSPLSEDPVAFFGVLTGTALCSASAAALNMIFEVPRDSKMNRTAQRPLVTGVLSTRQAYTAAGVWGVLGTTSLLTLCDPITTMLGVGNIALYSGLYTYMKPRTNYNTYVGAVVGAIPPIMGYTAAKAVTATGTVATSTAAAVLMVDPITLTLGGLLYFWQLPHFFALSYMYRLDYARGGFCMLPIPTHDSISEETAAQHTADVIVRNAWLVSTLPLIATACDITNPMFALEGLAINAYALHVAYQFKYNRTNGNARKIFLTSLWYLPVILFLYLLHSRTWDNTDTVTQEPSNAVVSMLTKYVHKIRQAGRDLCIHEAVIANTHDDDDSNATSASCPIVIGKEEAPKTIQKATELATDVVATSDAAVADGK